MTPQDYIAKSGAPNGVPGPAFGLNEEQGAHGGEENGVGSGFRTTSLPESENDNQRPAWLTMAHRQLDAAVASAYGWTDYSADMPDEEILKLLLALNLEHAGNP